MSQWHAMLDSDGGDQIEVTSGPVGSGHEDGCVLRRFFELAADGVGRLLANGRKERGSAPVCLFGRADALGGASVGSLAASIEAKWPIELEAPFEGTETIAGGVWQGAACVARERTDAVAKLRFGRGTVDLPMHAHEHSDRFIIVLGGSGVFHWFDGDLAGFSGDGIETQRVQQHDVLTFERCLVHTFSAPSEQMTLLSYHAPFIPLGDPNQYTVTPVAWSPRALGDA